MVSHTRRDFCKQIISLAGTTLIIQNHTIARACAETSLDKTPNPRTGWTDAPGTATARIDGYAKVSGEKIFARDFRARDIPTWPHNERRATILCATRCDKVFCGIDLSSIPKNIAPIKAITAQDLQKDHIDTPPFFSPRLFTPVNSPANYLGEPVAILIFEDTQTYLAAKPYLDNAEKILCYGTESAKQQKEDYFDARLLYFEDKNKKAHYFSSANDQGLVPYDLSLWQKDVNGSKEERAAFFAHLIAQRFSQENRTRIFSFQGTTQTVDPAFMEPEGGLGFYHARQKKLSLVLSTQSPLDDGNSIDAMAQNPKGTFPLKHLEINACYPGGGFGGRDRSILPIYLSLAAFYSGNTPVRIILSRYQQMQMGLKRHATQINADLLVDEEGIFQTLKAKVILDGGGRKNYSHYVAIVGAQSLACGYYFPQVDIAMKAETSIGVPSGSMRGFGSVQTIFATESLIDTAAYHLQVDPIELRLKNALRKGMPTLRGAMPTSTIKVDEVLNAAKNTALWQQRDHIRATKSTQGKRYGVGFALGMKSAGSNDDAYYAQILLDKKGCLAVSTGYIDMGNGAATALATTPGEYLGQNADRISMGNIQGLDALHLYENPPLNQQDLETKAQDQNWTAKLLSSASASNSVYPQREVLKQACRILFQRSIWPSALKLWGIKQANPSRASWQGPYLTLPGYQPLHTKKLARYAFSQRMVTGVMTHGYYQAQWAMAHFPTVSAKPIPIDALALKSGSRPWQKIQRTNVIYPPINNRWRGTDIFSSCAAIIGVYIDESTQKISVDHVESFIECGKILQPQIVEGQAYGGIAMGIGQALLESIPSHTGGAGDGTWNFDRYRVPRGQDLANTSIHIHLLEPKNNMEPPKGVAEVVMVPIIPAIANAVFHATGKRVQTLPINLNSLSNG